MKDLQIALDNILTDKIVNLKPENLKEGVSCLGVQGSLKILDTSDATAQQSDIFQGKTAYVNGEKITGTFVQNLGTKKITENGTYNASDDDLNGYSSVEVETSGVDINDYWLTSSNYLSIISYIKTIPFINVPNNMASFFMDLRNLETISQLNTSNVTNMSRAFYRCSNLKTIPLLDTNNVNNMSDMFYLCENLEEIPQLSTNNVTNMSGMFQECVKLKTIPQLDSSKVSNIVSCLTSTKQLINLGGFLNLGQAYGTSRNANYSPYTLDLSSCNNLSHESLMNVINNLYDIATKGCKAQRLSLGTTNLAKLTEEEIAIATNKGWNVT